MRCHRLTSIPKDEAGFFYFNEVLMEEINPEDELITFGGEIKALGDGKVGGYLVRFSTANDPDLTNDYFTKDTDLQIPDTLPVLYNHGLDKKLKRRVIGHTVKTLIDEVGAWVESQLDLRDEYEKQVYEMAKKGKLGYSSHALPMLVEREPAGKGVSFIKSWFVGEASLTPTPAEPRNSIVTLKSLIPPEQAALPTTEDEIKTTQPNQGEKKMENETDVKALIAAALKERDEAEAAQKAELKKIEDAKAEARKDLLEELKSKKALKASEYHTTEKTDDDNDGLKAFKSWLQTGQVNQSLREDDAPNMKTAFNVTSAASGGYLVPDPLYNRIIAKRDIRSWVRQAPCSYFQTSADHVLVPYEDTAATDFVVTSEAASYDENEPTVGQRNLALLKYTKEVKSSEEFLSDNQSNFDQWIADVLGRAEGGLENSVATAAMVDGSGATSGNTAATTASIAASDLSSLIGNLGGGYNVPSECGFLMKNATKWMIKGVSGNNFQFVSTPASGDFFGYPAYVSDDMAAATTGLVSVVFGNFTYFGVAEKPGMVVQRNPYLYMATGQISIFASIRRAYDVLQQTAFYYMTMA